MREQSEFLQRAHKQLAQGIQKFLLEDAAKLKPLDQARLDLEHPEVLVNLRGKMLTLDELEDVERAILAAVAKR